MQRITENDGEKTVGYGAQQTWIGILIPSFIKCVC